MRMVLAVSLTIVMSLFFSGCGPTRQEVLNSTMQSWVGHHRDDLLRSWGPPAQETRLSNGGSILSYRSGGGQVFAPMGNMVVGVPLNCQQDFETNSAGRIVGWRYQGHC
jgi:hypothetical protein